MAYEIDKIRSKSFTNVALWSWVTARRNEQTVLEAIKDFQSYFNVNELTINALNFRYKRMNKLYHECGSGVMDAGACEVSNDEVIKRIDKLEAVIYARTR